jgi:hypothetical protein
VFFKKKLNGVESEGKDISNYWMTLRREEDTGKLQRKR